MRLLLLASFSLLTALLLVGCVAPTAALYYGPNAIGTSSHIPPFTLPEDARVMAVSANPGNPIHNLVERSLSEAGLNVVTTGVVYERVPAVRTQYQSSDTMEYRTEFGYLSRQLFEEPEAEFFVRYSYIGSGPMLTNFSASLIEAQTGQIVTSYSTSTITGRLVDRILRDFASELLAARRLGSGEYDIYDQY